MLASSRRSAGRPRLAQQRVDLPCRGLHSRGRSRDARRDGRAAGSPSPRGPARCSGCAGPRRRSRCRRGWHPCGLARHRAACRRPSMVPALRGRRPKIASTVSERPAPTRPPRPRISPSATAKETSRTGRRRARGSCTASATGAVGSPRRRARRAACVDAPRSCPTMWRMRSAWVSEAVGREASDGATLAHDGDAVGDREDLLQPMRDEDQAAAVGAQARHDVEQAVDLARAAARPSARRR